MSGDVMVHCTRDSKCVKENGHRGRCSLQRRPCEEEMVAMLHQIRSLQVEITEVKRERDRLQTEVSNLWSKLAKARASPRRIVFTR
jgi:predicted RNase H-like nuclease (RuvC/YqgF family)